MAAKPAPLTAAEKEHFLAHGWIRLSNCFTREQAEAATRSVWTRLGMDPDNKSTWTEERIHMPGHGEFDASEFAPRAWAAVCELCGGEDRVTPESKMWRDTFIVNLGSPGGKKMPPQDFKGWHVDGDFFIHYLDSPEQGLLVIPLFTDIVPDGGATFLCPDAMKKVAQHLYQNPAGVNPHMFPRGHERFYHHPFGSQTAFFNDLAMESTEFVEAHGSVGDVFLLHPLMLHAASNNPLRHVRIITNPPVSLKEPFCFDRPDGNYSLVEKTTMAALGMDDLKGWTATAPREAVIPERVMIQEQMKMEELKRLEVTQPGVVSA
jgi:ectoine hydroxylase-related dioxygenase (phytanoyl-CoA dioxygenase family)